LWRAADSCLWLAPGARPQDVVNVLTPNGVVRKRQINAQMAYRQVRWG
jgi:hypothetical protein